MYLCYREEALKFLSFVTRNIVPLLINDLATKAKIFKVAESDAKLQCPSCSELVTI